MKNLYLIALLWLCAGEMMAQGSYRLQYRIGAPGNQIGLTRFHSALPQPRWHPGGSRAVINHSFYIDYDSIDLGRVNPLNPSQSYTRYYWEINRNYSNATNMTLRFAAQVYDSLYDVIGRMNYPLSMSSVRVDSFDVLLQHRNVTGSRDTVIFTVYNKSAASRIGFGPTEIYNTPPLWADTLYTNVSLTPPNLYGVYTGRPNLNLPPGQTFGIKVEFRGDTANKFQVIAGYRDTCSQTCGAVVSAIPDNSLYYVNYTLPNGGANISGINSLVYTCNPCNQFVLQNFYFVPYVTVGMNCPNVSVNTTSTACGANTGTASITITGNNVSPFTYQWSPRGFSTPNLTGLAAGTYTVTVTGQYGCSAVASGNVSSNNAPSVSLQTTDNTCYGQSIGTATLNISGGAPPYVVSWSNNAGNVTSLNNLRAGIYTATVRDNLNCTSIVTDTVFEPEMPSASTVVTPLSCNGSNDGAIAITLSGGTPPYLVNWLDGGSGLNRTGLAASVYITGILDSRNCLMYRDTFTLTQPVPLIASTDLVRGVRCFGQTNAILRGAASGGTPPYFLQWNTGSNNDTLTDLGAGTYSLYVLDVNGCNDTSNYPLTEPAPLSSTTGARDASGSPNGMVWATGSGGTPPYTYTWGTAGTGDTLRNLNPGVYPVTVTDANFCNSNNSASVGGNNSVGFIAGLGSVKLIPNPAQNYFSIQWSEWHEPSLTLSVYHADGRRVLYREKLQSNGHQTEAIGVETLSGGVYFVEIKSEKGTGRIPLVIE